MKRSVELRQQRAAIYEKVKGLLDKAAGEKRSLEATEQESIDKMEKDMEALRKTYEAEERAEQVERDLAAAPGQQQQQQEQRTGVDSEEYRTALWDYVRTGERRADLSVGTAGQAGYLAPTAFEAQVVTALTQENILRQLATVRTYGNDTDIPVKSGRATFAYIAEKGAYPEAAQTYTKGALKAYKCGGVVKVSEELMEDSVVNIETEVREEIVYGMGRLEESKFVAGSGAGEPTGFTGTATTGVTTAAALKISGDDVIDLFHALPPQYRGRATWLMNDGIAKVLRKVKSDNGTYGSLGYIWQPALQAGNPDTILGRPVRYSQDMDNALTAGKKVMAFGDFSFYRIADRTGLQIQRLNELYAGNGQVGFRCTRRNDGLLLVAEAIQLMVMHA